MHGNNILQTTTTTGTGNLVLATETGFAAFSSQFSTNELFKYTIRDATTKGMIESGLGYLDGSGDLVRSVIQATFVSSTYDGSNPSAVTLASGSKEVVCSATAHGLLASSPGVWSATHKGYGDMGIAGGAGVITLTADRAYAVPFQAGVDSDIDAILCRVTTASAAGKLLKAAVFAFGSDGLPGVKLAESGTVAADSTGVKAMTFTRFRPPPRFFAALVCDGAPLLQSFSTGMDSSNSMGFDASLIPISYIHHVGATSLTFPTTWTAVANLSNSVRPQLVARCP